MHLSEQKQNDLSRIANAIRISIIEMLSEAKSGHSGGPLGMADIFATLFFHTLRHNPKEPRLAGRDRLILSNGHICPVLYATMAHAGYFPLEELHTLRKFGSHLQGHPHREWLPALETSSGPLGSGLSQAIGMALADRMDHGKTSHTFFYCLMGDGELDAGEVWEAAMMAGKERLSNIIAVVDRNHIQIDGYTEDIMPLEPLRQKWEAFNWHVLEIDGHNHEEIADAFDEAKAIFDRPTVILAHTIPGKGVSYMERDFRWHGTPPGIADIEGAPPKEDQVAVALRDLRAIGARFI